MTPEQFVEQVQAALANRLKSVVLYGSAVTGDFVQGSSGYDLLIVVDPLGVPELDSLMPIVARWTKSGQPVPQVFSPAQLTSSTDTFAIELSDIQQSRRVLFGTDLPASLTIERTALRHQLERELKGKLLSLRQKYLLTGGKPKAVLSLMIESLSSFEVLCRAALRLFEESSALQKHDALQRLREHIEFDLDPFFQIEELKKHRRHASGVNASELFIRYLKTIETIVTAVDHLPNSSN